MSVSMAGLCTDMHVLFALRASLSAKRHDLCCRSSLRINWNPRQILLMSGQEPIFKYPNGSSHGRCILEKAPATTLRSVALESAWGCKPRALRNQTAATLDVDRQHIYIMYIYNTHIHIYIPCLHGEYACHVLFGERLLSQLYGDSIHRRTGQTFFGVCLTGGHDCFHVRRRARGRESFTPVGF